MKYSFLMPYKDRAEQFYNTLISLRHWYGDREDWEVVVVLDGEQRLIIPDGFPRMKRLVVIRDAVNPAPLFNMAAAAAEGDYLIITNPECYHVSNVLGWYDKVFTHDPDGYAVAACDNVKGVGRVNKYQPVLGAIKATFQHSTQHNVMYHYCSAMSRDSWHDLGGFDERFGAGYACEDDDFRDRIWCGGWTVYLDDTVRVLHQEHTKYRRTPEIQERYRKNLALLRAGEQQRGYHHDVNAFKC